MIYPNHKITADAVKKAGAFLSLHSDGCIVDAVDGICELGYDAVSYIHLDVYKRQVDRLRV